MATKIDRAVNVARRRLVGQAFLNRLTICLSIGLVLATVWLLIQPFLIAERPTWLSWIVPLTLAANALVTAVVLALRAAPTRERTALEIDTRFALRERLTTAIGLNDELRHTSAGIALLADAEAKVAPLKVAERFPVRPRRSALWVPALAGCLALVASLYNPSVFASDDTNATAKDKDTANNNPARQAAKKGNPFVKPPALNPEARQNKSDTLKELENQLEKLGEKYAKDPFADTAEKAREKLTDLQPVEERLKKFADEKFQKLQQLDQKLQQLESLSKDKDFADGPAKDLADALAKGDMKKAEEEVDELRKKAKDKKLDKKDQQKLERQLDKLKSDLERLARDKEREEELQKKIDQAKKEGKDAESLERELEKTKEESKQSGEQLEQLAQKLGRAKQALSDQDLEKLEAELAGAKQDLQNIDDQIEDLKEAEATLQRIKEERKAACAACQGEGEKDGELRPGKSGPNKGGIGAGERDINDKAQTAKGEEERVRGLFDAKGKKTNGGLVRGAAFTKKSEAELGQAIKQAAQEAPSAPDAQRLPRDARDSVKEYFERLGGTGK